MHMPFAGGMRIDLQCLPGDDAAHLGSTEGAREWIGAVAGPWYGEHIQWTSTDPGEFSAQRYADFVRVSVARIAE